MKKVTYFVLATAAAISATTISNGAHASGKRVAWFDAGPTHPYVAMLNKTFNDRAKELGLEVTQFDTPYDPALQSQQVDDAIARKFDLLAVMPTSQKGIVPALNRAKQAGIPVVIINNGIVPGVENLYVTEVGEDNKKLGGLSATALMDALKKSGRDTAKVALITGNLSEGVGKARLEGFNEAIKAMPKVKVVATEDAFWDTAKSEQIAGQLFAKFAAEGGLDAVVGWSDNQNAGIARAAAAAGLSFGNEKGKLLMVGISCDKYGVELIKEGKEIGTGLQSPMRTGKRAAELVADALDKKTLPKFVELPVLTIDKANLGEWAPACTY